MRNTFIRVLKGKKKGLLARDHLEIIANNKRWVIIYGATNNIGQCMARVVAKHGYSIVLVDSNLDKLQHLQNELFRVFPALNPFSLDSSESEEG